MDRFSTTQQRHPAIQVQRMTGLRLSDTGKRGWYIAPNFSINLLSDFNNNNVEITYDTGYAYGISIGKEINPGFSVQLDVAHIKK